VAAAAVAAAGGLPCLQAACAAGVRALAITCAAQGAASVLCHEHSGGEIPGVAAAGLRRVTAWMAAHPGLLPGLGLPLLAWVPCRQLDSLCGAVMTAVDRAAPRAPQVVHLASACTVERCCVVGPGGQLRTLAPPPVVGFAAYPPLSDLASVFDASMGAAGLTVLAPFVGLQPEAGHAGCPVVVLRELVRQGPLGAAPSSGGGGGGGGGNSSSNSGDSNDGAPFPEGSDGPSAIARAARHGCDSKPLMGHGAVEVALSSALSCLGALLDTRASVHAGAVPAPHAGRGPRVVRDTKVSCDACGKWRSLPPSVSGAALPDTWVCSDNTWNLSLASCEVPEDGLPPAVIVLDGTEPPLVGSSDGGGDCGGGGDGVSGGDGGGGASRRVGSTVAASEEAAAGAALTLRRWGVVEVLRALCGLSATPSAWAVDLYKDRGACVGVDVRVPVPCPPPTTPSPAQHLSLLRAATPRPHMHSGCVLP
jgi:hypothetical protein